MGQLPAQAQAECCQTGGAQGAAVFRLWQVQRPGKAAQQQQCCQRLPHRCVGATRCQLELFSIKRISTFQ